MVEKDPKIIYSVSATTRPKRNGEEDKVDYFFLSGEKFHQMEENDAFAETATVYGYRYGTPKFFLTQKLNEGFDVIMDVDVQGAMSLRKHYPDGVYIFIAPPSLKELGKRLRKRGTDSEEDIQKRLDLASEELKYAKNYDYLVVNQVLPNTIDKIQSIIISERQKIFRQKGDFTNAIIRAI